MRQGSRNLSAKSSSPHCVALASAHPSLSLTIHPLPPFRLDLTVWALRRRPENILDRWDGRIYRRVLLLDGKTGAQTAEVAVEQTGSVARPCLSVTARVPHPTLELHHCLRATLERMLGATSDLRAFYSFAASQKFLRALIADFTGLKPPRYPTVFESLLNAISCQQVSLNVGIMLLNRLVQNFGRPAPATPPANACALGRTCPSPADLANLSTGSLRALGYSHNKERAILDLSRSVSSGELNLESFRELDDATALESLTSIRGIGRWSAEYALLRGMGRLNIFPGDDVGGWNNLQKHFRLRVRPDYAKTRKLLAPWKNYAGLIYFHFLLDGLRSRGLL